MNPKTILYLGSLGAALGSSLIAHCQEWPLTRAERTNYSETSHYADVMQFLHRIQTLGAPVSLQVTGTSVAGQPMPLDACVHERDRAVLERLVKIAALDQHQIDHIA